ncbi:uncharacterized protein N0V89_007727 [Didymosphaeria variabile]|uniref:Uncharacterized protein n=1 Tax=Didymosphaeria variabile TaxID=1932322 RepID=A0A9W8XJY1_9PLEO|nr:uncharacterized protein N0V89_007727 [Didymosphaeria variabile]KAJ4352379.1 hypothetical protein N0V89_007727 [Didymosphaeria variabile]
MAPTKNHALKKKAPPSEYAKALASGNILQCLPLELRQEVFAFAALHYIRFATKDGRIQASDISERVHEWLPPMCHVNDDFFLESLPMFLRHIDIVVGETYTAYGLFFFLQATGMFSYIYSLRYTDAGTLAPSFAGPQLLKECNNLRHVALSFRTDDFPSINRHKKCMQPFYFDKKAFLEAHSFRQLLTLKHIEKVSQIVFRKFPCGLSCRRVH